MICAQKNEDFDQTYLNAGSKNQKEEELSLDLIFIKNSGKISRVLLSKSSSYEFTLNQIEINQN